MTTNELKLGLGANWRPFTLLVIVNAFVGAMVGQERTLLPLIAEADFHLASRSVILSFLVSFGIVKALANLFAGFWSDRLGRKSILVAGWLVGLPVPCCSCSRQLGLGGLRQRSARRQPGAVLVHDGHHEDRPGRTAAAWAGHGPQ